MRLQQYYEDSYQRERGRTPREILEEETSLARGLYHYVLESKNRFLPNLSWQGLRVLELGSGRGGLGLLLARLGAEVTLVDFSESALLQAEGLFSLEGLSARMVKADVALPDAHLEGKFDIICDSHLLHCLTADPDRSSYYALVSEHLAPEGIFTAETMVHRKKLFIPDGFMFDEKNVLWQMFGSWTPVRRILDSLDLEKEIQDAGLRISYFYYYGQFGFVPHKSFMEIPSEILPAAVRMVLQQKVSQSGIE